MFLSDYVVSDLRRTSEGTTVRLSGGSNVIGLYFLGWPDSERRSHRDNILMYVPKRHRGIIALGVVVGLGQRNSQTFNDLIEVVEDDDIPVKLGQHWLPFFDRQGGIDKYGNVWTRIGDVVYTTSPSPKPGESRIDDGALLCQYMYRDIEAGRVIAAAEEAVAEQSRADRIKELEAELEGWKVASSELEVEVKKLTARYEMEAEGKRQFSNHFADKCRAYRDLEELHRRLVIERDALRNVARSIFRAFETSRWCFRRRRELIRNARANLDQLTADR